MRKAYIIKELEGIFGCSRTAITKKISEHPEKPGVERYKNRFEVVSIDGKKAIMFSDEELEYEKRLSKGVKNVASSSDNTFENDIIIDIPPENYKKIPATAGNVTELNKEVLETFKTTVQETLNNTVGKELEAVRKERDDYKNQLTLLEDKRKENADALKDLEYQNKNLEENKKSLKEENQKLKKHRTFLTVALIIITLVLGCFVTFYITFTTLHKTVVTSEDNVSGVNEVSKAEIEQKKIPVAQPVQEKPKPATQPVRNKK